MTRNKAPNVFVAAHIDAKTKKVDRTRLICPFPLEARYKGKGSTNNAANFTCAATPT